MVKGWFTQHMDTISMRRICRRFIRGISCFVVIPMCRNVQSIRIIFIWIQGLYPFQKKKAGMDTWYMKKAVFCGRICREKKKWGLEELKDNLSCTLTKPAPQQLWIPKIELYVTCEPDKNTFRLTLLCKPDQSMYNMSLIGKEGRCFKWKLL